MPTGCCSTSSPRSNHRRGPPPDRPQLAVVLRWSKKGENLNRLVVSLFALVAVGLGGIAARASLVYQYVADISSSMRAVGLLSATFVLLALSSAPARAGGLALFEDCSYLVAAQPGGLGIPLSGGGCDFPLASINFLGNPLFTSPVYAPLGEVDILDSLGGPMSDVVQLVSTAISVPGEPLPVTDILLFSLDADGDLADVVNPPTPATLLSTVVEDSSGVAVLDPGFSPQIIVSSDVVPEPATLSLLALGLSACAVISPRRRAG